MRYVELKIAILLNNNIDVKGCGYFISTLLSSAMAKDEELLRLHNVNQFKMYSYDNLYPLAKNGVYEANNIYTFRLRSIDENLIMKLKKVLYNHQTNDAKVLMIEEKKYHQRPITELRTLTPAIVTIEKNDDGRLDINKLANIQDEIISTLVKKYNFFFKEEISKDAVAGMFKISSLASKPIGLKYKNVTLIGIKYKFIVAEDELSQKLAFLSEAVGIGEKCSSCGAGFVHATYEKAGE